MKRLNAVLFLSVLLLSACSSPKTEYEVPINFYYPANPEVYQDGITAIAPEIREGAGYSTNTDGLVSLYFAGPIDERFISNFPVGTELIKLQINNDSASIVLSEPFAQLSGYELSTACACISLTLFDLCGVDKVNISAQGSLLDGNKQITMPRDSLILYDNMKTQND